jgi:hypothetical protein
MSKLPIQCVKQLPSFDDFNELVGQLNSNYYVVSRDVHPGRGETCYRCEQLPALVEGSV